MTTHVDAMELVAYSQGRLRRRRARTVREHCLRCEECGDQLAAVLLLRESRSVAEAARSWWPRVAAAILVVAVAVPVWWRLAGAPATTAVAPETFPLPASLEPAVNGLLWNIDQELGIAELTSESVDDAERALRRAASELARGHADEALRSLGQVGPDRDIRVELLRGLSMLLVGDPESASATLLRVATSGSSAMDLDLEEPYRDAAILLMSEALVRMGDRRGAVRWLEQIAGPESAGRDWYSDAAVERLKALR